MGPSCRTRSGAPAPALPSLPESPGLWLPGPPGPEEEDGEGLCGVPIALPSSPVGQREAQARDCCPDRCRNTVITGNQKTCPVASRAKGGRKLREVP